MSSSKEPQTPRARGRLGRLEDIPRVAAEERAAFTGSAAHKTATAAPAVVAVAPRAPKREARTAAGAQSRTFSITPEDDKLIKALRLRCGKLQELRGRSDMIRAGLRALAAMDDDALLAVMAETPKLSNAD